MLLEKHDIKSLRTIRRLISIYINFRQIVEYNEMLMRINISKISLGFLMNGRSQLTYTYIQFLVHDIAGESSSHYFK